MLCDWGGGRLRAFLQEGGSIVGRRDGPGIGALRVPIIAALRKTLQPWRDTAPIDHIVMCGMVGSRNGLVEVPYVRAPVGLQEWASQGQLHRIDDLSILIGAGICGANTVGAPDVMRGEETQIFGALECKDALTRGEHTLLLPGTHSKWAQIIEGRITTVQTYITGELFGMLARHSSLMRAGDSGEPAEGGFRAGLARARQSDIAEALFETRAAQLVVGRSSAWAREFLSGLLIGGEVRAALRAWAPKSVVLVGDGALVSQYLDALASQGVAVDCLDGDRCVLAGLRLLAAHHHLVK